MRDSAGSDSTGHFPSSQIILSTSPVRKVDKIRIVGKTVGACESFELFQELVDR